MNIPVIANIPATTSIPAAGSQPLDFERPKGRTSKGRALRDNVAERKVLRQLIANMRRLTITEGMCAASLFEDVGDLKGALLAYDTVLTVDASHRLAHLGRGAILMQQEDWAESVAAFEEAARLDPEDELPYTYLGQVLDKSGQADAAAAAWAAAERRDPVMTQITRDLIKVSARFKATGSEEDLAVWDQLTDQVESHERIRQSRRSE